MPVGAAIGIGGSIAGRIIQGHQQSKATNAQIAAQEKANQIQERMYGQTREDLAPFRFGGQAAFGKLGEFLGLPSNASVAAGNRTAANTGTDPRLGIPGYDPASGVVNPTAGSVPPTATGPESMVMMRAPTGQQKAVPKSQVAHFQQMGAQVV